MAIFFDVRCDLREEANQGEGDRSAEGQCREVSGIGEDLPELVVLHSAL